MESAILSKTLPNFKAFNQTSKTRLITSDKSKKTDGNKEIGIIQQPLGKLR